ncbi:MAG: hypothetical protein P1U89_00735 [Verrucomicrobiales bacterium]|nr:hypothetical protein [Verrucomicrobiales bacterium]
MPNLLQTICEHCGHRSDPFPDSYLALELDAPTGLESSNPHPDNELDAILPAKGRRLFLESHGSDFKSAMQAGKLLKYHRLYCRECGEAFEHRKYHISGLQFAGCLWPIATSVVAGIVVGLVTSRWPLALLGFSIGILISSAIFGGIAEMRLSKSLRAQKEKNRDIPRCPNCASIETTKHRIKCGECGFRSVKLVNLGKSR